ncbi:recombinase zinc beta ribbon domain-containing protein, partial [Patescibacteria group bacterium]|nr:recombinase zinc beta ribbon domain-containing protein [Patescibacteria group bacterium]
RTPLAKASISRMLTNQAYLGLVKHKGEYHEGRFEPILSATLFEAVQEILRRKAKPRKSKQRHDFPFTGLMTCGECGSAITAQFSRGKCGGIYRYYRCTKKKGVCSQKYIQEKDLATQLKTRLKSVAICDEWTEKMLKQVDEWEKKNNHSSQKFVQNLKNKIAETQEKLDKLVSAYIDGDIPKENYLPKKEELLKQKISLANDLEDFGQTGKNWLQPLQAWILDTKKANFLTKSDNFHEIKSFVQKIGTNPVFSDKIVSFNFVQPFNFLAEFTASRARRRGEQTSFSTSENLQNFSWWTGGDSNP